MSRLCKDVDSAQMMAKSHTEADARARMLIYLAENKLVTL